MMSSWKTHFSWAPLGLPLRLPSIASALACAGALLLVATAALASGSVRFAKREFKEASGGWNIMMTIDNGSTPATPHQPLRFQFTPTAVYERYLDDQHGETPQMRVVPLTGQMPLFESIDVDFSDGRGKIYKRTKFDFTITRAHNFVAGEYSVVVRRSDGGQIGSAQTIKLEGDNPVVDRRAISFVAQKNDAKKKSSASSAGNSGLEKVPSDAESVAKEKAGQGQQNGQGESSSAEPAAAGGSATSEASSSSESSGDGESSGNGSPPDSANLEKVPPSSKGCGCRTAGGPVSAEGGAAGLVLALAAVSRRRRGSRSRRPARI